MNDEEASSARRLMNAHFGSSDTNDVIERKGRVRNASDDGDDDDYDDYYGDDMGQRQGSMKFGETESCALFQTIVSGPSMFIQRDLTRNRSRTESVPIIKMLAIET
jgi:hypothetical protein